MVWLRCGRPPPPSLARKCWATLSQKARSLRSKASRSMKESKLLDICSCIVSPHLEGDAGTGVLRVESWSGGERSWGKALWWEMAGRKIVGRPADSPSLTSVRTRWQPRAPVTFHPTTVYLVYIPPAGIRALPKNNKADCLPAVQVEVSAALDTAPELQPIRLGRYKYVCITRHLYRSSHELPTFKSSSGLLAAYRIRCGSEGSAAFGDGHPLQPIRSLQSPVELIHDNITGGRASWVLSKLRISTSSSQVGPSSYKAMASGDPVSSIAKKAHYSPPWADVSIIGIAGSSGSGKSSIADAIVKKLNLPWVVILSIVLLTQPAILHLARVALTALQDSFYKTLDPEASRRAFNNEYDFDSPEVRDYIV